MAKKVIELMFDGEECDIKMETRDDKNSEYESHLTCFEELCIDEEPTEYTEDDFKIVELGKKLIICPDDTVRIYPYEGGAAEYYEIEIDEDEEFDPDKMQLNFAELVFKVGDEEIESEERVLWNITYDGKEIDSYAMDGSGSSANSDIWTSDDYESDDDEEDDE